MGRPKGSVNLLTREAREQMQLFVKGVSTRELKSLWARVKRTKPEQALAVYVSILKHFVPPVKPEDGPGTKDNPVVVEVRQRALDVSDDSYTSEAAGAAAHLARHGYETARGNDDED